MKFSIDEFNYVSNGTVSFKLEDVLLLQAGVSEEGQHLIVVVTEGSQAYMQFGDQKQRDQILSELITRHSLLNMDKNFLVNMIITIRDEKSKKGSK